MPLIPALGWISVSSMPARATLRDPLSKNKQQKSDGREGVI